MPEDLSAFLAYQQVRDSDIWIAIPGLTYLKREGDILTRFKLTSLDILAGRDMAEDCAPDFGAPNTYRHLLSIGSYLTSAPIPVCEVEHG